MNDPEVYESAELISARAGVVPRWVAKVIHEMNDGDNCSSGWLSVHSLGIVAGLVLIAVVTVSPAPAEPRPPRDPLHPADYEQRDRARYESTKAYLLGGAEGDAAVTSDRYDVQHYLLDLTVDPGPQTIAGSMRMVFSSVRDDLADVVLDLTTELQVDSILFRGGVVPHTHVGDSLVVHLSTLLERDEVDSVTVYYGGTPPRQNNDLGLTFKIHHDFYSDPPIPPEDKGPIAASLSEPAFAKFWWPCKDRPDDKSLAVVKLTVPDSLVAVSNGILRAEYEAFPGWKSYVWEETHPIASYLISIAVSDYVLLMDDSCITPESGYIPLRNWIFPRDVPDAMVDLVPLCDMMVFMESIAGPYPFSGEKYGHAAFVWGGAMEHQTATSYGRHLFSGDNRYDNIMVHELAHQWFGDSLGPREWADIWLNEGFATYCEGLWAENQNGVDGYWNFILDPRRYRTWEGHGPVYDPMPVFPGRVIYDKGAWILHMLRGRMGDQPFFDLLLNYATGGDRPLGTVTTSEFIDLASQYAAEDLSAFFDPWLNTDQIPNILFDHEVEDGPNGPDSHLRLSLTQTQSVLFDNVFPVHVTTAMGDTSLSLPLKMWSQSYTFDLAAGVMDVTLDPQPWVLWRESTILPPSPGLTVIYPNPATVGPISFAYRLAEAAAVTMHIYDARGRLIAEIRGDESPLIWDGRDSAGRRTASGVYWAALQYHGERSVKKFTIIR